MKIGAYPFGVDRRMIFAPRYCGATGLRFPLSPRCVLSRSFVAKTPWLVCLFLLSAFLISALSVQAVVKCILPLTGAIAYFILLTMGGGLKTGSPPVIS